MTDSRGAGRSCARLPQETPEGSGPGGSASSSSAFGLEAALLGPLEELEHQFNEMSKGLVTASPADAHSPTSPSTEETSTSIAQGIDALTRATGACETSVQCALERLRGVVNFLAAENSVLCGHYPELCRCLGAWRGGATVALAGSARSPSLQVAGGSIGSPALRGTPHLPSSDGVQVSAVTHNLGASSSSTPARPSRPYQTHFGSPPAPPAAGSPAAVSASPGLPFSPVVGSPTAGAALSVEALLTGAKAADAEVAAALTGVDASAAEVRRFLQSLVRWRARAGDVKPLNAVSPGSQPTSATPSRQSPLRTSSSSLPQTPEVTATPAMEGEDVRSRARRPLFLYAADHSTSAGGTVYGSDAGALLGTPAERPCVPAGVLAQPTAAHRREPLQATVDALLLRQLQYDGVPLSGGRLAVPQEAGGGAAANTTTAGPRRAIPAGSPLTAVYEEVRRRTFEPSLHTSKTEAARGILGAAPASMQRAGVRLPRSEGSPVRALVRDSFPLTWAWLAEVEAMLSGGEDVLCTADAAAARRHAADDQPMARTLSSPPRRPWAAGASGAQDGALARDVASSSTSSELAEGSSAHSAEAWTAPVPADSDDLEHSVEVEGEQGEEAEEEEQDADIVASHRTGEENESSGLRNTPPAYRASLAESDTNLDGEDEEAESQYLDPLSGELYPESEEGTLGALNVHHSSAGGSRAARLDEDGTEPEEIDDDRLSEEGAEAVEDVQDADTSTTTDQRSANRPAGRTWSESQSTTHDSHRYTTEEGSWTKSEDYQQCVPERVHQDRCHALRQHLSDRARAMQRDLMILCLLQQITLTAGQAQNEAAALSTDAPRNEGATHISSTASPTAMASDDNGLLAALARATDLVRAAQADTLFTPVTPQIGAPSDPSHGAGGPTGHRATGSVPSEDGLLNFQYVIAAVGYLPLYRQQAATGAANAENAVALKDFVARVAPYLELWGTAQGRQPLGDRCTAPTETPSHSPALYSILTARASGQGCSAAGASASSASPKQRAMAHAQGLLPFPPRVVPHVWAECVVASLAQQVYRIHQLRHSLRRLQSQPGAAAETLGQWQRRAEWKQSAPAGSDGYPENALSRFVQPLSTTLLDELDLWHRGGLLSVPDVDNAASGTVSVDGSSSDTDKELSSSPGAERQQAAVPVGGTQDLGPAGSPFALPPPADRPTESAADDEDADEEEEHDELDIRSAGRWRTADWRALLPWQRARGSQVGAAGRPSSGGSSGGQQRFAGGAGSPAQRAGRGGNEDKRRSAREATAVMLELPHANTVLQAHDRRLYSSGQRDFARLWRHEEPAVPIPDRAVSPLQSPVEVVHHRDTLYSGDPCVTTSPLLGTHVAWLPAFRTTMCYCLVSRRRCLDPLVSGALVRRFDSSEDAAVVGSGAAAGGAGVDEEDDGESTMAERRSLDTMRMELLQGIRSAAIRQDGQQQYMRMLEAADMFSRLTTATRTLAAPPHRSAGGVTQGTGLRTRDLRLPPSGDVNAVLALVNAPLADRVRGALRDAQVSAASPRDAGRRAGEGDAAAPPVVYALQSPTLHSDSRDAFVQETQALRQASPTTQPGRRAATPIHPYRPTTRLLTQNLHDTPTPTTTSHLNPPDLLACGHIVSHVELQRIISASFARRDRYAPHIPGTEVTARCPYCQAETALDGILTLSYIY